jgi:hypothetical protein
MKSLLRVLSFLLMSVFAVSGEAATYCVSNASQLHSALKGVMTSTDTIIRIKVRTGTYQATAQAPFELVQQHSNQTVEVSGGWSGANGACDNKSWDSGQTILLGTTTKPALFVVAGIRISGLPGDPAPVNSLVHVHGLSLRNSNYTPAYEFDEEEYDEGFQWDSIETVSACLNGLVGGGNQLALEYLDIRNCTAPNNGDALAHLENYGSTLLARNISARNGSDKLNGGMYVLTSGSNAVSRLSQLSLTTTNSTSFTGLPRYALDLRAYRGGTVHLSNSVVWDTRSNGAAVDGIRALTGRWNHQDLAWEQGSLGAAHLKRVHSAGIYLPAGAGPINTLTLTSGDPKFVAPGNPIPRSDSPLVNSGVGDPEGGTGTYDVTGKARVQGGKVDVGAFEYPAPVNQAPNLDDDMLSLPSNQAVGSMVKQFAAYDDGLPTPGTLVYTLQSIQTSPAGLQNPFTLQTNGKLVLSQALPQGQSAVYSLVVKVCDPAPLCDTGTLSITSTPAAPQQSAIFKNGFE